MGGTRPYGHHIRHRSHPSEWEQSKIEDFMRDPGVPVDIYTVDHDFRRHPLNWEPEAAFVDAVIAALHKAYALGHAVSVEVRRRIGS